MREIVLDTETTGLYTTEGHRLLEVTAVELVDGKPTGLECHVLVNPERDIPPETTKIHGITNEMVADKPVFAAVAKEVRDFIGASPIIITCRTDKDGYTVDVAFLNMEMEKAGLPPFPEAQWLNVRRWSEAMFGNDRATLNKVLAHYGVEVGARGDSSGHGSTLDARLLAAVYPQLRKDYTKFVEEAAAGPKPAAKPAGPKP